MENSGWIYLRVDEGRGFCFGKTDNPSRRDKEYRKENPFIKKVYEFFVADMVEVELELIKRTAKVRLFKNSKEWIRLCEESLKIVDDVRKQYAWMTLEQWQRVFAEEEARRKEEDRLREQTQSAHAALTAAEPTTKPAGPQEPTRQSHAEGQQAQRQRDAEWNSYFQQWDQARRQIPPEQHARQHSDYKRSMTVFRERLCPRCRIPAVYYAPYCGYRCPQCKARCP